VEEGKLAQGVSQLRSRKEGFHDDDDDELATLDFDIYDISQLTERFIAEVSVTDVWEDVPRCRTFISKDQHSQLSPEELSERWCIGLQQARNTIKITIRSERSSISPHPAFKPAISCRPTMDARAKSLKSNKYAQVFAKRDKVFAIAYPMSAKSADSDGLRQFIHDFSRPERVTFDGLQGQLQKHQIVARVATAPQQHGTQLNRGL
jgi:hypothetical protein